MNDLQIALRKSSALYAKEMLDRSNKRETDTIILFCSSIGLLLTAGLILQPVVSRVNRAREKVLALFVDIPNPNVVMLAKKCQKFLDEFKTYVREDSISGGDVDSNADAGLKEESDEEEDKDKDITGYGGKGKKYPKNMQKGDKRFLVKMAIGFLFLQVYFLMLFIFATTFISDIKKITT